MLDESDSVDVDRDTVVSNGDPELCRDVVAGSVDITVLAHVSSWGSVEVDVDCSGEWELLAGVSSGAELEDGGGGAEVEGVSVVGGRVVAVAVINKEEEEEVVGMVVIAVERDVVVVVC